MITKPKVVSVVLNNFKNDSRVLKEAISLQSNGYSTTVVALHEYPLEQNEIINNIQVHRIKLSSRKWSKNKFIQLLKYGEFLYRFVRSYKNAPIIHCNDLNTLPLGFILKTLFNKKVKIIYDSHEYAIDDIPHQSKTMIRLKYHLEKFLIKYADKVITVSDSIANEYSRLYGIPKPALVLNCPPYQDYQKMDLFREELGIRHDQIIFLYQGGLSKGRGIDMLLEVFSRSNTDDNNVIVFMGYGPLETDIKTYKEKHPAIFFKDAVPMEKLLNYTASADYGISVTEDTCLSHRYALPNKLFEYVMAGIPILGSNLPEIGQFVKKYKVGFIVKENTVDGFINALRDIQKLDAESLKINIDQARKQFTWEEQKKALLDVYESIL